MGQYTHGPDLALYLTTAALGLFGIWRGRSKLSVVTAFVALWIVLIALPSAIRYAHIVSAAKDRLFIATSIVNAVLLLATFARWNGWATSLEARTRGVVTSPGSLRRLPAWFWPLLGLSLALFAFHASRMPRIPLLELLLRNDITANQLTELREAASKLLPLPWPIKYVLYWNVRLAVPILVCTVLLAGTVFLKFTLLPLLLVLSALTLEKSLPTFVVISAGLGIAAFRRSSMVSRPILASLVLAVVIASGLQTAAKIRDSEAHARLGGAAAQIKDGSPSRGGRLTFRELALYPFKFLNKRILIGPSDVAYAWFEYFPDIYGRFLRGQSWSLVGRSSSKFRHPANLVGIYAYHEKDPEHYLETAYAYAAFHADAWANFGYAGVLVASVLAVLLLLCVDLAVIALNDPLTAGAAGACFSILLTTLPAGGVQAAMVAQGLLPGLIISAVSAWARIRERRSGES